MYQFLLSALIVGLSLSLPLNAQADDGGMVYYSVGGNLLNPKALNDLTATQAYNNFGSWTWGQGVGFYGVYHRFLFGLEYQSLFGQLSKGGQDSMRLDGNYGLLQLGYLVLGTSGFQVYPYLGIGPGFTNLRSSQPLNQLLSMSQGSNQSLTQVNGSSWLLDLGLGANLTIPMSPENPGDPRGLSLGLRAGYLLGLGNTQWSANELPVSGGPNMNPGGFYARLMIGFGSYL